MKFRLILQLTPLLLAIIVCGCSKKTYDIPLGFCTSVDSYDELSALGYDFVEEGVSRFLAPDQPDSVFFSNLEKQQMLGAKVISCTSFIPSKFKIVGEKTMHDEILSWAEVALRRAQMAGINYIVFGSGGARKVPEGFSKEKAKTQFIDICKKIAPIAKKYNIEIVIEPLNSGETNLINTVSEGGEIVEAVNHPNILLLCDIFHMMRENESEKSIIKYGKYIRHCHIAEKEKRSVPGVMKDDFTPYLAALKEINYQGAISIEASNVNLEEHAPLAISYLREQIKLIQ